MQSITKKSDETIDSYVKRIKEIKDKLTNVSSTVNDEDIVIYALNGLPTEYNIFRTSMRTRSQSVTFDELHVLMKSEESAIAKQSKSENVILQPTAMYASQIGRSWSNSPQFSHGRGRGRSGRGRTTFFNPSSSYSRGSTTNNNNPYSESRPLCQICGRLGHMALDCYNRMNYNFQGKHPTP